MTDTNKIQLLKLLEKSLNLVSEFKGGYSDHFYSAEEFTDALRIAVSKYKSGDNIQIENFQLWFAPSYSWDDFTGSEGEEIGTQIFALLIENDL